ncbi:hypothetical protein [Achromobacter sp. NFACC18-2]|uniref:hypothetical protein n=1 Tax=Achromobacter sp. NFACC18-2 TaxID=1564112 RepID=UPI0008B24BBA|nr:hypothetical protein [Achromobacter sp. NFACC18-2]SEJ69914.1 hypothetical protein SAMN03159494_03047 [Achromobacter sp. NFACC18-2]
MSNIIGFAACSKELKRLLDDVAKIINAAKDKDSAAFDEAVITQSKRLVDFTNQTEAEDIFDAVEVDNIRSIDEQAEAARKEIMGKTAAEIINVMHGRIVLLNQLEKTVKQQTAENEHNAKRIRLIPVRNAIDAVTETIDAFKKARDALADDQPNEANVKARIDAVLRAISAVEKAAQDL